MIINVRNYHILDPGFLFIGILKMNEFNITYIVFYDRCVF